VPEGDHEEATSARRSLRSLAIRTRRCSVLAIAHETGLVRREVLARCGCRV
jgi:hypothetical protein